ncbi:hypothetical protein ACPPVT_03460 [Angustibacter sp. McL0619]|uniref:hypothetical protein n=1 Tax=Angustibacter sp. McL0619 TaxID=3415676 RepID=UPI003CE860DE
MLNGHRVVRRADGTVAAGPPDSSAGSPAPWPPSLADARVAAEIAVDRLLPFVCAEFPDLLAAATRLCAVHRTRVPPARFLAVVLARAAGLSGSCSEAAMVTSAIWWAGAETLDDLADEDFAPDVYGLRSAQAMLAGVSCLTWLPYQVLVRMAPDRRTRDGWLAELASTSMHCAQAELLDVTAQAESSWGSVIRVYHGKTGAPYGRDLAITALAGGLDRRRVRAWRTLGGLFGVLRQLANDEADTRSADPADLRHGTWTLRLAHLVEAVDSAQRPVVLALRQDAMRDAAAAQRLRALMAEPAVSADFTRRVRVMGRQALSLVDDLSSPGDDQDLANLLVRSTVAAALPADEQVPT